MITGEMHLIDDLRNPKEKKPTRDGFGKALVELAEKDDRIWGLTADVAESTRIHWFAERFPKRFVQVGIAEQNMAGVAAGIALTGKRPYMSAYAVFSPGRNLDQIRVSIAYTNAKVVIHASHSGLSVGEDGASHQALEDIAIMRTLPNMCVMAPADFLEAKKATYAAHEWPTPVYIRTERPKLPIFTTSETPFVLGEANLYRDGKDVAIFSYGAQVYYSLLAAEELEKEGISVAVVDFHTIKPLDKEAILHFGNRVKHIVTVEDHQVNGGLGGAVAEIIAENKLKARLRRHGVYDRFGESGPGLELLKKYGLDDQGIKKVVLEEWEKKDGT